MNKTKFFATCDSCDQSLAHQLYVTATREYRGLDNIIKLSGSTWCRGGLTGYTLYKPIPGRQGVGDHPYREANIRIETMMVKFQKWLAEWKALRTDAMADEDDEMMDEYEENNKVICEPE